MCLAAASPHERSRMVSGVAARVLLLDREDCVPSPSVIGEGERTRTISLMRLNSDSAAIVNGWPLFADYSALDGC